MTEVGACGLFSHLALVIHILYTVSRFQYPLTSQNFSHAYDTLFLEHVHPSYPYIGEVSQNVFSN